jgi:hypothetical protein
MIEKIFAAKSISGQIGEAGQVAPTEINPAVGTALNAVFGLIGIVAVVMVIIGGVSIATSQGDPSKIKKGRLTITYGLIGMVVALLAFAIVNLVLTNLGG